MVRKQELKQTMRPVRKTTPGHIVVCKENEFWYIDVFDFSKNDKLNKNYNYIFTHTVYCIFVR